MTSRFSVVTRVCDPAPEVLRSTIRSVERQTFHDWELCLVDDASRSPEVVRVVDEATAGSPRVRAVRRAETGGPARAANDGVAAATGEFIALLDSGDQLHADALRLVDEALDRAPDADFAYTDEDEIDDHGHRSSPFYKPDWSPERLRTQMYTSHLSVLRRSLVDEVGGVRPGLGDAHDWDLVLRVTERARRVVHVPHVLYHWRPRPSPARDGADTGTDARPYARAAGAGVDALQQHCERIGLRATVTADDERPGVYHLRPALDGHPRVSIVIPTNGGTRDVRAERVTLVVHCVRSIVERTHYDDYEIVVVADSSTPPQVLDELRSIAGARLRVVDYPHPFNFADKINVGALAGDGEHVLMLNDDMEVVTPDWLQRLVMYSSFPGIGAVGAKLLFGDGRLQHTGLMLRGAAPGHLFHGFPPDYDGYADTVRIANNYSAVTGACLMTSRATFDEVGGLSLGFPLSYNDVDYCMKVRARGQRVVYDPDTVLYHFESSSRSPDVSPWELDLFRRRWRCASEVDPYDNPNFHPSSLNMVPPLYAPDGEVTV